MKCYILMGGNRCNLTFSVKKFYSFRKYFDFNFIESIVLKTSEYLCPYYAFLLDRSLLSY